MTVALRLDPHEAARRPDASPTEERASLSGLTLEPAGDGRGLVVTGIERTGDAALAGLAPGDVILSVNDAEIATREDLRAVPRAATGPLLLCVERDGAGRFVVLSRRGRTARDAARGGPP